MMVVDYYSQSFVVVVVAVAAAATAAAVVVTVIPHVVYAFPPSSSRPILWVYHWVNFVHLTSYSIIQMQMLRPHPNQGTLLNLIVLYVDQHPSNLKRCCYYWYFLLLLLHCHTAAVAVAATVVQVEINVPQSNIQYHRQNQVYVQYDVQSNV
jgi:hypothetical protein